MPPATVAWNVLFALLPAVIVLMLGQQLVAAHANVVTALLTWLGVETRQRPVSVGQIAFSVPELVAVARADAFYAATLAIVGALIAGTALLIARRLTPARVLTGLIALVASSSGFLFWFAPHRFPYTPSDFAAAWCRAEFIVWLVIPALYSVVLSPLPISALTTLLITTSAVAYAMWFSAVRLALLMLLFHSGSLMWMAPAYFAFGFLIDFVYIVAYYSQAVARAAKRLENNRWVWRW